MGRRIPLFLFMCVAILIATTRISTADNSTSIPPCPTHNPYEWHALYDAARNCHYDHEHKDNPGVLYANMSAEERTHAQRLIDVFGAPGAWFGGTSISYPWETFMGAQPAYTQPADPNKVENKMKHEGYGWIARTNLSKNGGVWISDFRLQYHAIFAAPGAVTRYHSYSLEVNLCHFQHGCRIMQTGGWLDFGYLRINGNVVPTLQQDGDGNRQRLHRNHYRADLAHDPNYKTASVWYGMIGHPEQVKNPWKWDGTPSPINQLTIALETWDTWSNAQPANPYLNELFCPAFDCNKNGSTVKLHRMRLNLPEGGFDGYTDRFGLVNTDCEGIGRDCIPTFIEEGYKFNLAYNERHAPREYDTSPEGIWWIKYPN